MLSAGVRGTSLSCEGWGETSDGALRPDSTAVVEKMAPTREWQDLLRVPLYHAAKEGRASAVSSLLSAGAAATGFRDLRGSTLIHAAASGGSLPVLAALLEAGCDADLGVQESQSPRRTPLLCGVWEGHRSMARALVTAGADPKAEDAKSRTALHLASIQGHPGIVSDLLRLGLEVEARDGDGYTPLALSVAHGRVEVLRLLLGAGASMQTRTAASRDALDIALREGHVDCLEVLLDAGANPESVDQVGLTALLSATRASNTAAITALVAGGADVDGRGGTVWTPLHFAAHSGDLTAIEALVSLGGDLNARTSLKGSTPLHIAAGHAQVRAVQELLLRWGANEAALDARGQSASDVAGHLKYVFDRGHRHEEGVQLIRLMLANAPADRSWIRRRAVMMLVSRERSRILRERMHCGYAGGSKKRGAEGAHDDAPVVSVVEAGEPLVEVGELSAGMVAFRDAVVRLAGMDDEGIFRSVISFL